MRYFIWVFLFWSCMFIQKMVYEIKQFVSICANPSLVISNRWERKHSLCSKIFQTTLFLLLPHLDSLLKQVALNRVSCRIVSLTKNLQLGFPPRDVRILKITINGWFVYCNFDRTWATWTDLLKLLGILL